MIKRKACAVKVIKIIATKYGAYCLSILSIVLSLLLLFWAEFLQSRVFQSSAVSGTAELATVNTANSCVNSPSCYSTVRPSDRNCWPTARWRPMRRDTSSGNHEGAGHGTTEAGPFTQSTLPDRGSCVMVALRQALKLDPSGALDLRPPTCSLFPPTRWRPCWS